MSKPTETLTPVFVASYPNLFKPRLNDQSGKEEFSVVALFAKGENLGNLKAAAKAACIEKWGKDTSKWPRMTRNPFRDQGERATKNEDGTVTLPQGYENGAIFINMKSQRAPGIVDQNRQPIIDQNKVYPGCHLRAYVNAYAYEVKGNVGVAFGLQHIQFVKDGDALGGMSKPEDVFEKVEMTESESGDASGLFPTDAVAQTEETQAQESMFDQ